MRNPVSSGGTARASMGSEIKVTSDGCRAATRRKAGRLGYLSVKVKRAFMPAAASA